MRKIASLSYPTAGLVDDRPVAQNSHRRSGQAAACDVVLQRGLDPLQTPGNEAGLGGRDAGEILSRDRGAGASATVAATAAADTAAASRRAAAASARAGEAAIRVRESAGGTCRAPARAARGGEAAIRVIVLRGWSESKAKARLGRFRSQRTRRPEGDAQMSQTDAFVSQLKTSHKYMKSTISIFEEEDAGFRAAARTLHRGRSRRARRGLGRVVRGGRVRRGLEHGLRRPDRCRARRRDARRGQRLAGPRLRRRRFRLSSRPPRRISPPPLPTNAS